MNDSLAGTGNEAAVFAAGEFRRPEPALLTYYTLCAAMTLIAFPFVWLPLFFRYKTLRFEFDDEGVSMAWGILFKKEIILTYRRIQDIHVKRNLFHRWLGLAAVAVQTASGSSGAEMTIEGIRDAEGLRDFLYSRMRGATGEGEAPAVEEAPVDEALVLLTEIRDLLAARSAHEAES